MAEMAQFMKVYDKTVETLEIIKKEKQNMSDFTYTQSLLNSNSTAVKHAYYNVDDKTLLVVMRENGNAYRYDGVPVWVWNDFKAADSLGRFFANTVKRSYGPSKYLGVGKNLNIVQKGIPAPNMGSVTSLHPSYRPSQTVGTPKGLTVASDASVTTKAEAFPLRTVSPNPVSSISTARKATTTVHFVVNGNDKTVLLDDKSTVDEALVEFDRIASMLGVSAKVTAVTVNFV